MKRITAAVLALVISLAGDAIAAEKDNYPKLKAGEWEMSVSHDKLPPGMPPALAKTTFIYCIDDSTQEKMIVQSQNQADCGKPQLQKKGDTFIADLECEVNGRKMRSHTESTFVSNSELKNQVTVQTEGQPEMSMTSTAKYLGACKAGRRPGDMAMVGPNGQTINMGNAEELMKLGKDMQNMERKGSRAP
ncbi:MAG: DUF3617 family protein [Deltaproteobacteria bacterium]|nr:DUF3617 family protein [Deltaproteobacteria bacterium]